MQNVFYGYIKKKLWLYVGIITAIAWPAVLVSAASVLDNPWNVGIQRASSTGKELAEVLLARQQVIASTCSTVFTDFKV
jgi:hypothetical protein